uniref:Glucosamine 6-phosphate N-acetyltransferase n=1 Tax=Syphacia muris TaxID=451379 RepID=A0A0N5B097_9BILA
MSTAMLHCNQIGGEVEVNDTKAKASIPTAAFYNNNPAKNYLFDGEILKLIQLKDEQCKIPDNLFIRPLHIDDRNKGYLELLKQLTVVGQVSEVDFVERFYAMSRSDPTSYYVIVIEDTETKCVVGTITLVIELKFIHSAGIRGRVEDLVVDSSLRGKHLGKILSMYVVELARLLGVYKLSLECKDSLIKYYQKFGYIKDPGNNFMLQRFDGVSLQ